MISVLIPIYNRDVRTLVNSLYSQVEKLDIPFEFLLYDDGSLEKYKDKNRELGAKYGVSYMELSKNLGRSKIRNWLGKNARYNLLLFMDCDQYVVSRTFVQNYLEASKSAQVIYGGTVYKKKPAGKSVRLHWKYGRKVESQSAELRSKFPFRNFRSNNFLIMRDVFLKFPFDEKVEGYGYEDSMIGRALEVEGIKLLHIDNPLEHAGLEKTEKYLDKTAHAIRNLTKLHLEQGLRTRLTDFHDKMLAWGMMPIVRKCYAKFERTILKNLYSENPNLRYFQWYKLMLFDQCIQQAKTT